MWEWGWLNLQLITIHNNTIKKTLREWVVKIIGDCNGIYFINVWHIIIDLNCTFWFSFFLFSFFFFLVILIQLIRGVYFNCLMMLQSSNLVVSFRNICLTLAHCIALMYKMLNLWSGYLVAAFIIFGFLN